MKHLFFFMCLLITSVGIAQIPQPNKIYYPNTVNTPTDVLMGSIQYLCGPNTVVYDTLGHGCRIYVSSNCTLTIKPNCSMCAGTTNIYLQGNSVLNFLSGNCYNYYVAYEPTATINNPFNIAYSSATFTALSWPTVNCNANGIKSNNLDSEELSLYPNPSNNELNISFASFENTTNNPFVIYNAIGQSVRKEEVDFKNKIATIKTDDLPNGIYLINLKSANSGNLGKRFVIAR